MQIAPLSVSMINLKMDMHFDEVNAFSTCSQAVSSYICNYYISDLTYRQKSIVYYIDQRRHADVT